MILENDDIRFKVALSFAGEHRSFVEDVAICLSDNIGKDKVFYDNFYQHELARLNLDVYLQDIYLNNSKLIVLFLCEQYSKKEWCMLEWRVMRDIIKKRRDEDIMIFRFSNIEMEGLLSIDGFIDIGVKKPVEINELILKRLNYRILHERPTMLSKDKSVVELVLDIDFDKFSFNIESSLQKALVLLLKDHDVLIKAKRPGNSTIVTLELTDEQLACLTEAIEDGHLSKFRLIGVNVNGMVVLNKRQNIKGNFNFIPGIAASVAKPYFSNDIEFKRINFNASSISKPLIIFYGPNYVGKTNAILRLCRFLSSNCFVKPSENFRYDFEYSRTIQNFLETFNYYSRVPQATGLYDFLLLDIFSKEGKKTFHLLDAAGDLFFDKGKFNLSYPETISQIFGMTTKKIFIIFFDKQLLSVDNITDNYIKKIIELARFSVRPNIDKIILLYNKCDVEPEYYIRGKLDYSTFAKQIFSHPKLNYLQKALRTKHRVFVQAVPFSSGNFTIESNGNVIVSYSSDEFPMALWNAIQRRNNGRWLDFLYK